MVIPSMIIHTGPRVAEIWLMVFPRITGSLICVKNRTISKDNSDQIDVAEEFFSS